MPSTLRSRAYAGQVGHHGSHSQRLLQQTLTAQRPKVRHAHRLQMSGGSSACKCCRLLSSVLPCSCCCGPRCATNASADRRLRLTREDRQRCLHACRAPLIDQACTSGTSGHTCQHLPLASQRCARPLYGATLHPLQTAPAQMLLLCLSVTFLTFGAPSQHLFEALLPAPGPDPADKQKLLWRYRASLCWVSPDQYSWAVPGRSLMKCSQLALTRWACGGIGGPGACRQAKAAGTTQRRPRHVSGAGRAC